MLDALEEGAAAASAALADPSSPRRRRRLCCSPRLAAAKGLASAVLSPAALEASTRAVALALPALLDALCDAAIPRLAGSESESDDESGDDGDGSDDEAAAAELISLSVPTLLSLLAPRGRAAAATCALIAELQATGGAGGGRGGGPAAGPAAAAALLKPAVVAAALRAGGEAVFLETVLPSALDCLLAAGAPAPRMPPITSRSKGISAVTSSPARRAASAAGLAAAAVDALASAAAALPLPVALEWVLRPLLGALHAGPGVAAAVAACAAALGGRAAGKHVVPPLVAILSAPRRRSGVNDGDRERQRQASASAAASLSSSPPRTGTFSLSYSSSSSAAAPALLFPSPATIAAEGALSALESLVPLLPPDAAATRLLHPRLSFPKGDSLLPSRLAGLLLRPGEHSEALGPRLRCRVAALLLRAAADVASAAADAAANEKFKGRGKASSSSSSASAALDAASLNIVAEVLAPQLLPLLTAGRAERVSHGASSSISSLAAAATGATLRPPLPAPVAKTEKEGKHRLFFPTFFSFQWRRRPLREDRSGARRERRERRDRGDRGGRRRGSGREQRTGAAAGAATTTAAATALSPRFRLSQPAPLPGGRVWLLGPRARYLPGALRVPLDQFLLFLFLFVFFVRRFRFHPQAGAAPLGPARRGSRGWVRLEAPFRHPAHGPGVPRGVEAGRGGREAGPSSASSAAAEAADVEREQQGDCRRLFRFLFGRRRAPPSVILLAVASGGSLFGDCRGGAARGGGGRSRSVSFTVDAAASVDVDVDRSGTSSRSSSSLPPETPPSASSPLRRRRRG